jgi:hypothetical protein
MVTRHTLLTLCLYFKYFLCRFNIWLFVCLESRWHFHFCTSIGRRLLAFPVGSVRQKVKRSRLYRGKGLSFPMTRLLQSASGVQTMALPVPRCGTSGFQAVALPVTRPDTSGCEAGSWESRQGSASPGQNPPYWKRDPGKK